MHYSFDENEFFVKYKLFTKLFAFFGGPELS